MHKYSKLIGSAVGLLVGWAASALGLTDGTTAELTVAITTLVGTYLAPAND